MKYHLSLFVIASILFSHHLMAKAEVECLLRGSCVETQNVMNHLQVLQEIADQNDGNRSAGTRGHELSANYIAQQLLQAGYDVKLAPFRFMKFSKLSSSIRIGDRTLDEKKEYEVMNYSGSADVTRALAGVDLELGRGNKSTSGCEIEDFKNFVKGSIAVIQRGTCSFQQKVENAQNAGAAGVILFNQGDTEDREALFSGTLSEGSKVEIPAIAMSYPDALDLLKANLPVEFKISTLVENKVTHNVIAETKTGNPDNVIMVGAHLDSVPEGPGINDNGSGSAGILEIALSLKDTKPVNKVRFAWFSAEELGLVGSTRYVESLTEAEKRQISLYINVDMIGSPNYMLSVYDGDGSKFGQKGPEGSAELEAKFHQAFKKLGVPTIESELNGRSDYAAFAAAGIAVGGVFTGAEGVMSEEEATLFNGRSGEAYDKCYHQPCDGIENISEKAIELNTNAIAAVTYDLASLSSPLKSAQKSATSRFKNRVIFPKHLHCHEDVFEY